MVSLQRGLVLEVQQPDDTRDCGPKVKECDAEHVRLIKVR